MARGLLAVLALAAVASFADAAVVHAHLARNAALRRGMKGDPKESFGEGTHDEEFTNEYVPVQHPTVKEPNPATDKAWQKEMHQPGDYDMHGDYIRRGKGPYSSASTLAAPVTLLAVLMARLF